MDILTWLLPLIIASITALGVWFGSQWAERRRRRKGIREKIKRQILILESPFSKINEEETEIEWVAIGMDAIKPLRNGLKTAKSERTQITIVRALYNLEDEEIEKALLSKYEGVLKNSKDYDEIRDTLEGIKYLKIVELAPQVFDRLKREKVEQNEMIRTIGELEYGPALSYLIDLATECLKKGEPDDHILHFCVMAIGNIAPTWNELSNEEFHRIIGVFTEALKIEDRGLIDAVVRCELPRILKCKHELREPLKKELIETLAQLLEHKKSNIRKEAVERLTQLDDNRAVPYLKKLLDQEKDVTVKPYLKLSLKMLEQ